ncbi:MAG: ABC transporter substrate-binding protein [Trebonia sp.]
MRHSWTRNSTKRLGVLASCATLTLGIAACSGSSSSSSGPTSSSGLEETHLTVGVLPIADDAPLYIAIKKGYFAQEGLTVSPVTLQASTDALPDMLRGSVDIMAGANYVSFFQAQAKGVVSLKILADATHCQASSFEVMALPGSGITSAKSLDGKTIGVNLTDNVQTLTLNDVLKADGVNPSSVHYTVVPFPDNVAALKAHRIDAFSGIEPYITAAEKQLGASSVLSQCTGPTADFPMSGYFSTASWAQKDPNTAKAFQKALDKAQAYADGDSQAVRQILPTYTTITPKDADILTLNTYPASVDVTALQQVAALMQQQGLLTKPLNVSSMVLP